MKPNFQLFDPKTMDGSQLPAMPGNYLFLLRQGSKLHLPAGMVNPQLSTITLDGKEYQVIYTGKASKSLRTRDFKQHFEGNDASRSTLRKSLGCLMGFTFVPRNGTPNVRYKKFCPEDERKLSEWMREHLLLAYTVNPNPIFMERGLIEKLNPPLNLADNTNAVNRDFRAYLSQLRSRPVGEGYPAPILRDGRQNEHVTYETSSWLVRMYLKRKGFLFFCSVEVLLIFGLSLALFFDLKGLCAFELVALFVIMRNVKRNIALIVVAISCKRWLRISTIFAMIVAIFGIRKTCDLKLSF